MDAYSPINGISLERYAELSADVSDTTDPNKQAEIVQQKGVSRADWEAAKAGWTARMQDMSNMGQIATRYMALYQAELAKKSPAPQISFDDYVAMSACVPVIGYEGMLAHYKVTSAQWTQIAGHWNGVIPTNPQYMRYGMLVEQESARIRAGGQPKPVTIGAGAPAGGAAPAGAPGAGAAPGYPGAPGAAGYPAPGAAPGYPAAGYPAAGGYPGAPGYGAPNAYGQQNPYAQQGYNAQAQQFGQQVGSAFNAFGNALGSLVDGAIGSFSPGARVTVQWSDGNRYPGTVMQAANGQVQVAFPNGQQVWVPQNVVSLG